MALRSRVCIDLPIPLADPLTLNSRMGTYTQFGNLLDLCAVALPAGRLSSGVGFGISLLAPAWHDDHLAALAQQLEQQNEKECAA